jgi:hypothetical protein
VSDLGLPLARLARRWVVSGALGRNTRSKTDKALDAAERLDVAAVAGGTYPPRQADDVLLNRCSRPSCRASFASCARARPRGRHPTPQSC